MRAPPYLMVMVCVPWKGGLYVTEKVPSAVFWMWTSTMAPASDTISMVSSASPAQVQSTAKVAVSPALALSRPGPLAVTLLGSKAGRTAALNGEPGMCCSANRMLMSYSPATGGR